MMAKNEQNLQEQSRIELISIQIIFSPEFRDNVVGAKRFLCSYIIAELPKNFLPKSFGYFINKDFLTKKLRSKRSSLVLSGLT